MRELLLIVVLGLALTHFACAAEGTAAGQAGVTAGPMGKIPVIFETDIGDDIDDTWALLMLLRTPKADLKLVTTTYGKQEYRGKLLARLLTAAGRTDVPIGLGAGDQKGTGGQQDFVKDYDLGSYAGKVHKDGVQALIDTIHASRQPITVIAVGPLNTLGAAVQRDPSIAAKAHLVGMHGSVRKGYDGKDRVDAEWNVKQAVKQAQAVFSAPWKSVTITPLDTCGLVRLGGERFARLRASPDKLTAILMDNYRMWAKKQRLDELKASSVLFDTAAVYLALYDRSLANLEELRIAVDDKGFTRVDPAGKSMLVATSWKDLGAYQDLLTKVIEGQREPK